MRILFNAYPSHCQNGGAVIKLRKIKEYMERHGHTVDLFDPWTSVIGEYDVYHHFGFFPADLPMIRYTAATGVPVVIETMYWASWRHALRAPAGSRLGWARRLARYGVRRAIPWLSRERMILRHARMAMVNSEYEGRLVSRHFRIPSSKMFTAPNGVDRSFAGADRRLFQDKYGIDDFILVTGMIEERKNQLGLIRASKGTGVPLVLIGNCPADHRWYYDLCRREADGNVHFVDYIEHDDPLLASAYAGCRVLALPSWHETTGKSALEAALLGKNVVMTTYAPAAREYLGDLAFYVDPGDTKGIRDAVLRAYEAPPNEALRARVEREFLWDVVLERRRLGYEQILS